MTLWSRKGSPAERPWRVAVYARARVLRTTALAAAAEQGCTVTGEGADAVVVPGGPDGPRVALLANEVLRCAAEAERFAGTKIGPVRWLTGAMLEGAWANLHGAEEHLLHLLPEDEVRGQVPVVAYQVRRYLRRTDPRRVAVDARVAALAKPREVVTVADRALFANALRGVFYRNSVSFIRVRSLRNTQFGFAALFVVLAVLLAVFAAGRPEAFSLCVETETAGTYVCPTGRAKPTGGDVPLVELVGLLGAAVAAARAVTGTARPAAPYSVVVGQALLKTTLGAITAVIGVWFLRAGAVPGVDDVDSAGEILVWAVVFGYAQQVLTQLIDRRSAAVGEDPVAGTPAGEAGAGGAGGAADDDGEVRELRASGR